jgi:hypothetical protein
MAVVNERDNLGAVCSIKISPILVSVGAAICDALAIRVVRTLAKVILGTIVVN